MTFRPRRSVLYMPGSNARALEKAKTLEADALILDLEDAVAPDAKEIAREQVCRAVQDGGYGDRELVIRINGLDTTWGKADLKAAAAAGPHAILVPKVSFADDIYQIGDFLDMNGAAAETRIWAMMETPMGILNAAAIAASVGFPAGRRFAAMVLGTNDLAKETRARIVRGRLPMITWLSQTVQAARAHGLDVIDGVFNDFEDMAAFREECAQGRDLGMDGKTLIHPKQIAVANEVFSPTATEVEWAEKIIAAFALPENAGKGVITVEGRMVELLHAEMAQRTVAMVRGLTATPAAA
ncbi:HpcH/HpaI aldolase/citrate lyase family protein [Prosthecomicrobium hirschii]|uniref:HpcH/HpaI aldolase/citrate lyase family protein n=1 Tax=Prosthecodimorpha hirschii TaxID=665126 RepID=UPI00221FBA44|nr:CoA ester lyase [Prosthecomicrobium hirschii]MCW1842075.1 CoA ester lyase [Prosthecomicrobium hirschii]